MEWLEVRRHTEQVTRDRLASTPAAVLIGPRQVGKTTLARSIGATWQTGSVYLDLERPADARKLDDADAYLRSQRGKLVIIDEIHRAPGLFEVLRGVIDERRHAGERHGQFLLLGSAAIELMRQAGETLAGRVAYVDVGGIDMLELSAFGAQGALADAAKEPILWLRGGFPESLLATNDAASLVWRADFIRSYLERDVPVFAPRMPASTIGRLWTMLANAQGSLLDQTRLAQSLGVSVPTIARYLDLLIDLKLVRRLPPWSGNIGKRLVKTPKVYVRDSGLVHALLDLPTLDAVLGHIVAGPSYEGLVIENLLQAAGPGYVPYFYRSHAGVEIDLVLEKGGRPTVAVEVKRSTAPSVGVGFQNACDELGVPKHSRFLVYPGSETFGVRNGATAIGLLGLMQRLSQRT